jgi:hypothetical protein
MWVNDVIHVDTAERLKFIMSQYIASALYSLI